MEKSRKLIRDSGHVVHPSAHNKGKELLIPDDDDAHANDKLSSGRSPSTSPSPGKNARGSTRTKLGRKHLHRPTFSDVVNGASHQAKE